MGVRTALPHCTHTVTLLTRTRPLSAAIRGSFVHRQVSARGRLFAGVWPLCESVKNFFACGGLQVKVTSAWLPCSAACRRLTAWCGYACTGTASASATWHAPASSRSSAASTAAGCASELSVCARSSQDRRSALGAARHSLHVAVDYFLLGSNLDATGAISSLDVLLWRACCRVAALFF